MTRAERTPDQGDRTGTPDQDDRTGTPDQDDRARTPLTRDRVIDGAVALADTIGIDRFTIRRLAAALGVKPMTVYHHLPNKEAIVDAMVDRVFSEIDRPPVDLEWKPAIRHRAHSARRVLARHPWAAALMESRRNPGPETLAHHDAVIGCLRRGGLSIAMTAHAYAVIDAFIYGFALQEVGLPDAGEEMAGVAESLAATLPADLYPDLAALTTEHVMQPGYDFGAEFDFGIDLILEGLEAAAASP